MNILVFLLLCLYFSIEKESRYIEFNIKCLESNGYCVIPVSFGSNNELFQLQLDTTTSNTWIPSTKFDMTVPKYNISNSKYSKLTNQSIEIVDEDGIIYGKMGFDYIKLENIYIDNYGFVLANSHDKYFKDYPNGKLGLGYSQEKKDFHFIQKLKENEIIDQELFTIDKFDEKLVIGKIPNYLLDLPSESCSLYDVSSLDPEYSQSWACEIYKIFCGVYIKTRTGLTFDKDGNIVPFEYKTVDFDKSKDVYGPAIFDSAYPYIRFPIEYLDYIKGNLIMKFLKGSCSESIDEDHSIYFICKKAYINLSYTYL